DHVAHAEFAESREACLPGGSGALEANRVVLRDFFYDAGAAEQLQIIEPFMAPDLAATGHLDRLREQNIAAISRVADSLRDARDVGDRRGFECVLQQNRAIEASECSGGLPLGDQS